jgi:hypothetical protein
MKLLGSGGYVLETFAVDFKLQLDNSIWGRGGGGRFIKYVFSVTDM